MNKVLIINIILLNIYVSKSIAQESVNEFKNFTFGCAAPGAHSFSMSSNADGGLKVSTVFDFKSWQMVQRTLGLAHVPPDMHDSSITLLEGQVTTGRCESSDSNANIECVFNEPVTANLSTGWGLNGDRLFDFKILSFRKITNDTQKVLLEIQLASMDGTKSGKTQTWTYEKSNCSLDQ